MTSTFKQFKERALARPEVRKAYEALAEEFSFIDEVLKARTASGLTQADLAARVGTTQSAIARLESGTPKHSPSIVTLQRYARAMGYLRPSSGSNVRAMPGWSIGRAATLPKCWAMAITAISRG
jgi:DNA-binding XRE family transcriptional regulator